MRVATACVAAVLLAGCAMGPERSALPKEAIRHTAVTADGWGLSLVQYLPTRPPTGRPVLLCHGISANGRQMDLDERHSMARWFAAQGREAWTLSVRATGDSDTVNPAAGRRGGFTFDTLWQEDLAAAVAYVRAHAQHPAADGLIDYVGHSMGGLMAYAYLASGGEGLAAAATLGSPARLDFGGWIERRALGGMRALFRGEGLVIPVSKLALLTLPVQGRIDGPMERLLFNPANTQVKTWQRLIEIGTGDVATGVWFQLAQMLEGRFASADGAVDYRAAMAEVRTPVLVVAGKLDRFGTPPAVRAGYRALGGPKQWLLLGEASGTRHDYGHMDFLVGEHAAEEVWPLLLSFFERQAALSSGSPR
jgi:pimeloyl-ACP methyl ester carboxylesterase